VCSLSKILGVLHDRPGLSCAIGAPEAVKLVVSLEQVCIYICFHRNDLLYRQHMVLPLLSLFTFFRLSSHRPFV